MFFCWYFLSDEEGVGEALVVGLGSGNGVCVVGEELCDVLHEVQQLDDQEERGKYLEYC